MIIFNKSLSIMSKSVVISELINFDNKALRSLPLDPIKSSTTRQVPNACFSLVEPDPIKNPKLVAYSSKAFELLDLELRSFKNDMEEFTHYICGNKIFKGSQPAAHCYCGHQFGNFAGQLGDGAAMYIGEIVNKNKERWEIQFKGSGKTPYSRFADGRKVLRSSLREFLCSEAMYYLDIPTSRASSIVTSDSLIERDIFYDGHPIMEKASVVLRIAPTFIRFGSFEICKPMDGNSDRSGPSVGNGEILKTLLHYVIETFYPDIWKQSTADDKKSCYLKFFAEIVKRTAILVAKWQSVGFCHGVLNTDNMSIVGITIDYGPYGFMDRYDPDFICNASDTGGRYSYTNQPSICKWNCVKLAEALKNIIPLEETKAIVENIFDDTYKVEYFQQMFSKIGMKYCGKDEDLITDLLQTMYESGADYTNTFLALEKIVERFDNDWQSSLHVLIKQVASLDELKKAFKPALSKQDRTFFWRMANNDPVKLIAMGGQFILNEDEKEKHLEKLEAITESDHQKENGELWKKWIEKYRAALKEYCAANNINVHHCLEIMKKTNPRIVLRNYLADIAIKAAEKNDFTVAQMLMERLEHPFSEGAAFVSVNVSLGVDSIMSCERPPTWAQDLKVT